MIYLPDLVGPLGATVGELHVLAQSEFNELKRIGVWFRSSLLELEDDWPSEVIDHVYQNLDTIVRVGAHLCDDVGRLTQYGAARDRLLPRK